ncbi:MAG: enoyl-CoA hydratase-related protein, partial [Rhodospirillaceae bacterium]
MSSKRVEYAVKDGLARITLINEHEYNSISLQTCEEFAAAAAASRKDSFVKAVLLEARGNVFSVGGDINGFVANKDRIHDHVMAMTDGFHAAITDLREGTAPYIV